jgi:hypothetical protein
MTPAWSEPLGHCDGRKSTATAAFPVCGASLPSLVLSDQKLRRRLTRPPHWIYHVAVERLEAPPCQHSFDPLSRNLYDALRSALGLADVAFRLRPLEYVTGHFQRGLNCSPITFAIPFRQITHDSHNLAFAAALVGAATGRPLPPWVLLTGKLRWPLTETLDLDRTDGLAVKARLCLRGDHRYDVVPLLRRLYDEGSTEASRVLGPWTERTLSGGVRLLVVPESIDPGPQELPSDLAVEPCPGLPLDLFEHGDFEQALTQIGGIAGKDLMLVQVPGGLHLLRLFGYHRLHTPLARAACATWRAASCRGELRAFRVRASDPAGRARPNVRRWLAVELDRLDVELGREVDIHGKLRRILASCGRLLGCVSGNVALRAPETPAGLLSVWGRWGEGSDRLPPCVPADQGVNAEVLRSGRRVVLEQTAGDPRFRVPPASAGSAFPADLGPGYQRFLDSIHACADFPLKIAGRVEGVLCLHRDHEGPFDEGQLEAVQVLADRAAQEVAGMVGTLAYLHSVSAPAALVAGAQQAAAAPADLTSRRPDATDLETLGDFLARLALRITGGERAWVRVLSPDRRQVRTIGAAAASEGWPAPAVGSSALLAADGAAQHAFSQAAGFALPDAHFQSGAYVPIDPEARTHVTVLLGHGPHVLGFLSVEWRREPLSPTAARLAQLALEQRAADHTFALRTLLVEPVQQDLDAWFAKLSHDKPDFRGFLELVAQLVGTDRGSLFLREPATGDYTLSCTLTHPDWSGEPPPRYRAGVGRTGWVIEQIKPLRLANIDDPAEVAGLGEAGPRPSRYAGGWDRRGRTWSFLAVPVAARGKVLGVLRLLTTTAPGERPAGFDDYDERLLLGAATRLAERLDAQQERTRDQAVRELRNQLIPRTAPEPSAREGRRSVSSGELAATIFEAVRQGIGPCTCLLRRVDCVERDAKPVEVLDLLAVNDPVWGIWQAYREKGQLWSGEAWATQQPVYVPDLSRDPHAPRIREEAGGKLPWERVSGSFVCVPLLTADPHHPVAGTLSAHKPGPDTLTPDEQAFVARVGRESGRALNQMRHDRRRSLQEALLWAGLTHFLDLSQRTRSLAEQETALLAEVGEALALALEAHPYLWRCDPETGRFEGQGVKPRSANMVRRSLEGGFVAVCEPDADTRLRSLLKSLPGISRDARNWQRAAFRIGPADEPLALFLLLIEPPNRLSWTLAQQAAAMLATTVARPLREARRTFGAK